jgi:hypothetical protein
MTHDANSHLPTPEFRNSLQNNVTREFRLEQRRSSDKRAAWRRRVRTAAVIVATLVTGIAIGAQPAQVIESMRRDANIELRQMVVSMLEPRVQQAKEALARTQALRATAAATQQQVTEAELLVRQLENQLQIAQIDLAEARMSAATSTNSLSAPLLGGRDFVKERLQIDLAYAEHALQIAVAELETAKARQAISAITAFQVAESQLKVDEARSSVALITAKIGIRDRFHREKLDAATVEKLTWIEGLRVNLFIAEQKRDMARQQLDAGRERHARSAITRVELMRLELALHDADARVELLNAQLRALGGR